MSHQPSPSSSPTPPPPEDLSSPPNRRRSRAPGARRHKQRPHVFETAFVSSGLSSTEDLDEVDRIANHPLLQQTARLAANAFTANEMGGSVDRGVSSAAAFMDRRRPTTSISVTTSPVSWAGGGGHRMSRSATLHTMAAATSGGVASNSSGAASPVDSHHHSWGSSFFPFSRPRAALTRIMRLRKPHSCDNILDQQPGGLTAKDYSPRSLRDGPKGSVSAATPRMTTSKSVSNILFHHLRHKGGEGERDESSSVRCHERLRGEGGAGVVTPPDFPRNTTAAAVTLQQQERAEEGRTGSSGNLQTAGQPSGSRDSPGAPGSVLSQSKGFFPCGERDFTGRECSGTIHAKSGCASVTMTGQVKCDTVGSSSCPRGSCPAGPPRPIPSTRTSCRSPSPAARPAASPSPSNYSSPLLVHVRTIRSSPVHFLASPTVRIPATVPSNPAIRRPAALTNSPQAGCASPLLSAGTQACPRLQGQARTDSPFYCKSESWADSPLTFTSRPDSASCTNSPLCGGQRMSAVLVTDSPLSFPHASRTSSPEPTAASQQSQPEASSERPAFELRLPCQSRGGSGWAGGTQRPPGGLAHQGPLPTPPSTAPAQKKMIMFPAARPAASTAFRFGRPARGFATSEMDVSRLGGGGEGGVGNRADSGSPVAGATMAEKAVPSSAESTPQKATVPRCRLRPRRRLDLQIKQKRYLREAPSLASLYWLCRLLYSRTIT